MTCCDSSLGSKAVTLSRKVFQHSAFILATCIHSFFHAPAGSQGGSVAIMLSLKRLCSHRWWQHPRHNGKGHSLLGRCTSVATKWYDSDTFPPFPATWENLPRISHPKRARNITMAPDSLLRAGRAWWNSVTAWGTGACHLATFLLKESNMMMDVIYIK